MAPSKHHALIPFHAPQTQQLPLTTAAVQYMFELKENAVNGGAGWREEWNEENRRGDVISREAAKHAKGSRKALRVLRGFA